MIFELLKGLTLKQQGGNIVVARIMKGSMIDKQGQFYVTMS
jgi:hypothetical protein